MHIVIIGGGGVGYELARSLSTKKQDVVLIEKNADLARRLNDNLDAMVIEANGASATTLERAGIKEAEMVIAVTEVDEVNIISCMLAKQYKVPITVARVRNTEYVKGEHILSNAKLGIDITINPEWVAAFEMAKIIRSPNVSDIEYFAKGKVMLIGVNIDEKAKITDQRISELPLPTGCIIVAISRASGEFIIPSGEDKVYPNDKVYLLGSATVLADISWLIHKGKGRAHNITILGGGMIGYELANMLEKYRRNSFSIKLIDKSSERCSELSKILIRTIILQGDATDLSFFKQEEIEAADVLVCTTGDDRTNILAAVLAKQLGVKKIISEVVRSEYTPIFHTLGISSVISPRLLTAAKILRLTRKEGIVSLSFLKNEDAEVVELIVSPTARVANKKIAAVGFPKGMLVGTIVRNNEVILPGGDDYILPGDRLIIFTLSDINSAGMNHLFAGK